MRPIGHIDLHNIKCSVFDYRCQGVIPSIFFRSLILEKTERTNYLLFSEMNAITEGLVITVTSQTLNNLASVSIVHINLAGLIKEGWK